MRAHRVEVLSPALDNHLRFGTRAEPFEAEALIAEFAVEAFRDAIKGRRTGPSVPRHPDDRLRPCLGSAPRDGMSGIGRSGATLAETRL